MDAQQIYDNFHSQAQGTGGLGVGQEAAQQLAASSQDRGAAIQQLMAGIQAGWTGSAANAAAEGLVLYSLNELDTQDGLTIGQGVIERQMNSFQSAASEVLPVPPAPAPQNIVAAIMSGQDVTPMYQQLDMHYAAQALNVDAYNRYVGASQGNTVGMPIVLPVDLPNAAVSVSTERPAASTPAMAAPYSNSHLSSYPRSAGPLSIAHQPTSAGPAVDSGHSVPTDPGSSSTAPSSDSPGPVIPSGQSPTVGPPPSAPGSPTPPAVPIGPVTGVSPSGADPVPVAFATGTGSQRPGEATDGRNFGAVGFVGVVEPDPWAGSSGRMLPEQPVSNGAGGEPEAGPRSGTGAEVVSQSESLGSGVSSGRTNALAETGPISAGRRSVSEEDDEYASKYLEEEDGNELFGVTGAIVPAVIGENVMERTRRRNRDQRRTRV